MSVYLQKEPPNSRESVVPVFLPFYFFTLLPLTNAGGYAEARCNCGQNRNNHLNDELPSVLFHGFSF